jgi:prepilin-type N-terminal cleavage/methylation domain-containing protein
MSSDDICPSAADTAMRDPLPTLRRLRSQRGFTLLELMFVVVILSVLATIAVASYSGYIRQARMQEAVSFLGAIRIRQELYFQTYSQFVDTGSDTNDFYPTNIWPYPSCDPPAQWSLDCSTAATSSDPHVVGFCTLGVELMGDGSTLFQYLSFGWAPGDTADSDCSNKLCLITDTDRPWWVAISQGDQRCEATHSKSLAIMSSQLRDLVQFDVGEGTTVDDWGTLSVQDLSGGIN